MNKFLIFFQLTVKNDVLSWAFCAISFLLWPICYLLRYSKKRTGTSKARLVSCLKAATTIFTSVQLMTSNGINMTAKKFLCDADFSIKVQQQLLNIALRSNCYQNASERLKFYLRWLPTVLVQRNIFDLGWIISTVYACWNSKWHEVVKMTIWMVQIS